MKLIQNWSNQDKTKLLDRILEVLGDKEYVDIVVYGSRVSGDFTVKSDIDVGVYVDEIKDVHVVIYNLLKLLVM